jgi:hypothetical protein
MKSAILKNPERGIVLVTTLLIMLLMSALLAGFSMAVFSDHQFREIDQDKPTSFYAAHAGLEKLTADLGLLFNTNFAPTRAQIDQLLDDHPVFTDTQFLTPTGASGYQINFPANAQGNPQSTSRTIKDGPYQGLIGLVTPYTIDVTTRTAGGSEVHLQRTLQTVTIPVFQFGTFSDTDLGFHSGAVFNFGGRVHSNGNLYLAGSNTLTLSDKVTTAGEVIRYTLMNGVSTSPSYASTVNVLRSPGSYRNLARTEGSLQQNIGSPPNEPLWTNLSIGTYNGNIRSSRTGAKRLDLPLITVGGTPIDIIRRPATATEDQDNPTLFTSRYFSMAALRILLSDTAADILALPTVTNTPPIQLTNAGLGGWYNVANPPIAESGGNAVTATPPAGGTQLAGQNFLNVVSTVGFVMPGQILVNGTAINCTGTAVGPVRFTGCTPTPSAPQNTPVTTNFRSVANTPLIDGFIKIEKQDINGVWTDVTQEILNLGIAGRNLAVGGCAEPNPDAVIRLQRLRDAPVFSACGNGSENPTDYWPNALHDAREGNYRDDQNNASTNVFLGGVMHYVELDVNNLRRWLQGGIGVSGPNAMNITGYVLYFSDRRGNRNGAVETGEYGFEDFVNYPLTGAGLPNNQPDSGEDVNRNGQQELYGRNPILPPGVNTAPLDLNARPQTVLSAAIARVNRPVLFRRALKIVNGRTPNIIAPGLAVVAENPIYVQGDYNASNGFGNPHIAASVIGDALTILSNNWNDRNSFTSPQDPNGRVATNTWYRMAIIAGSGRAFPNTNGMPSANFGTDGGVHNFLRYLEDWGGRTTYYLGSIAIFFNSRQAVGTFKQADQNNAYIQPATRNYTFDIDFLTPALLPPRTPVFRDLNTLGFTQVTTVPD